MSAPRLAPGDRFAGRYSVRAPIAHSTSASTFLAVDSGGQDIVLKVFDPALGQRADVMTALARTASAAAQLPSDCAIAVLHSGYDVATSAAFVVSEWVPHDSLATVCARGPLPLAEAAMAIDRLSTVLGECHARQLAHLALKPTNVFIGPAPRRLVRLADFGMHAVHAAMPSDASLPWIAPEQLEPRAPAGPAADVFSVALLAFQLLTGRSFWRACASGQTDLAALRRELVEPRALASRRAAELGVRLPDRVDSVFAQALSVAAAERPKSARALADVLAAAARADEAAVAIPRRSAGEPSGVPSVEAPAGGSTLRRPVLAGVGVGLLVGGAILYALGRPAASPQPGRERPTVPTVSGAQPAILSTVPLVAPSVARLAISCAPACEQLLVDNRSVSIAGAQTFVDVLPGRHSLEARRAGYSTVRELVDLEEDLAKEIRLTPLAPNESRETPSAPWRKSLTGAVKPCKSGILKRCP